MRKFAIAMFAAAAVIASPAAADEQKPAGLTIEKCVTISLGLNSLNWAGQQLGQPGQTPPTDSKPYKFSGTTWLTIGQDIDALNQVVTEAQKAQQRFVGALAFIPPAPPADKADPDAAARASENKQVNDNWQKIIAQPCNVTPGHIKASDLKIGSDPDSNAIPPSVLGALWPIIDR